MKILTKIFNKRHPEPAVPMDTNCLTMSGIAKRINFSMNSFSLKNNYIHNGEFRTDSFVVKTSDDILMSLKDGDRVSCTGHMSIDYDAGKRFSHMNADKVVKV